MAGVLPDFEGVEVVGASVVVKNAGDGLSAAMSFDPFVMHKGDQRYLVLSVECIDVQHPDADRKHPEDGAIRKHILRASTGTFLEDAVVTEAIQAQEARIAAHREAEKRAAERARGVFRLEDEESEEPEPE